MSATGYPDQEPEDGETNDEGEMPDENVTDPYDPEEPDEA